MHTQPYFSTDQERFWAPGQFGDEYVDRNDGEPRVVANTVLFADVLRRAATVNSVIEFGANVGMNLRAIHRLLPDATLSAVEINRRAGRPITSNRNCRCDRGIDPRICARTNLRPDAHQRCADSY